MVATGCHFETNCNKECSFVNFHFLNFPQKEGPMGFTGGYFWTCVGKQTWVFPGLDVGGHKNPSFRSPPEQSTVDWQPELLSSEYSAISERDGLLLHRLGWRFLRNGLLSEIVFTQSFSFFFLYRYQICIMVWKLFPPSLDFSRLSV